MQRRIPIAHLIKNKDINKNYKKGKPIIRDQHWFDHEGIFILKRAEMDYVDIKHLEDQII